jgi:sorbitol/mannitol transport system substrate-binding protein
VSSYTDKDSGFDKADLLKPMVEVATGSDGKMYGIPFYGESSMLMYRKDLLAAKGVTMPEHPTWDQVAAGQGYRQVQRASQGSACVA